MLDFGSHPTRELKARTEGDILIPQRALRRLGSITLESTGGILRGGFSFLNALWGLWVKFLLAG